MERDDDDGSLDPYESGGLWEGQGMPLTVKDLRRALAELADDLPVEIERYDGMGGLDALKPMHLDLRGHDRRAEAIVIVTM